MRIALSDDSVLCYLTTPFHLHMLYCVDERMAVCDEFGTKRLWPILWY
jgi:hypothetical protein